MKRLLCMLLALLMLCGCGDGAAASGGNSLARPAGCTMRGPVLPVLLVQGKPYYWESMATVIPNGLGGVVYVGEKTGMPAGYTELGELESVLLDEPQEDLQFMAGFEATGTVYTNPETPETIYVQMTTDWFSDRYVRFVYETVEEPTIAWHGNLYQNQMNYVEPEETVPAGFAAAGELRYTNMDGLPQEDLETNGIPTAEKQTVYVSQADDSVLYLESRREDGNSWYYPCYRYEE